MKIFLSILFCLFTTSAFSKDTVIIYYPFGTGDSIANYSRTLAEEANKSQDKYTFLIDFKPGAGGAIGANHVKNTPNSILAASSSFFVRPNLYPTESYNIKDFKELMPQCKSPIAISTTKYKSWRDVPLTDPLTIGISGLGSTTHLTSLQLVNKYSNLLIVPFKSPTDSMASMLGKQTDLDVGFLGAVESWKNSKNNIAVLGITGTQSINGYTPLINEGFPASLGSMMLSVHLVVPATIDNKKYSEWREILVKAANTTSVRNAYKVDFCVPMDQMADKEIDQWFNNQVVFWKNMTTGVVLEK